MSAGLELEPGTRLGASLVGAKAADRAALKSTSRQHYGGSSGDTVSFSCVRMHGTIIRITPVVSAKLPDFFRALKRLVSLISRLVACSPRIVVDKQTDR